MSNLVNISLAFHFPQKELCKDNLQSTKNLYTFYCILLDVKQHWGWKDMYRRIQTEKQAIPLFAFIFNFCMYKCIFIRVNSCHNCKNKEFMTIGMEFSIISNVILEYLSFLAQKCNLFSKHVFLNVAMCIFSSYVCIFSILFYLVGRRTGVVP